MASRPISCHPLTPRKPLWSWVLAGLLVLAPLEAQDPPLDERAAIAEAMARFKAREAGPAERERAVTDLLSLSGEGPLLLARLLAKEAGLLARNDDRLQAKLLEGFARRAESVMAARTSREGAIEVAALRAKVLGTVAAGDLSKGKIVEVCDPALARLRAILLLEPAAVWDADPSLVARFEELLEGFEEEGRLQGWLARATLHLVADGREQAARLYESKRAPARCEQDLIAALRRLAALATPCSKKDRETLAALEVCAKDLDPEELNGVAELNQIRILLGLPAQELDLHLVEACRGHSKDMVLEGFFSHDSPVKGKETPWQRAALAGTSANAENIAAGQATGKGAILAWWHSPGHLKNMLAGGTRTGLGRHGQHWTQLFGS